MIEVGASVEVERPAAEVFDFLADMANNPRWQRGMRACTWTSEPPLAVGSTYDQEASFLGKRIVSSFEVVELVPGEHIRIRTTSGTMPIDVSRTVAATGGGSCTVSAVVRGDASGVFRVAEPLLRQMVQRSVRGDYRRLKALLETD
jgi:uncharacterized membrane protein